MTNTENTQFTDYLSLRDKYPYLYVFKFDDNVSVVFRPLTWGEYQSVVTLTQLSNFQEISPDIEDEIFLRCVIDCSYSDYRENIDLLPAGIVHSTVQMITMLSGANDPAKLFSELDDSRNIARSFLSQIYLLLGNLFSLDKEKINSMYYTDILHYLAMSEQILSGEIPEAPFRVKKEDKETIDFEQENKDLIKQ